MNMRLKFFLVGMLCLVWWGVRGQCTSSVNDTGGLLTNWNQECNNYNGYSCGTPKCDSVHTPVGCGAIAIGQILEYYFYPNFPIYINSYEILNCFGDEEAPTLKNYNVNLFDQSLSVALHRIAVALQTKFSPNGSSFSLSGNLDKTYYYEAYIYELFEDIFLYEGSTLEGLAEGFNPGYTPPSLFKNAIINELENCRPVLYLGNNGYGGHWFVIDDYDNCTEKFHLNLGGSTNLNGWYYYNDFYGYNLNKIILIGIIPSDASAINDACTYVNNRRNIYSTRYFKQDNQSQYRGVSCPILIYPTSLNINNNRIQLYWTEVTDAVKYKITITDIQNNNILYNSVETYLGYNFFETRDYFPPNTQVEIIIEPYDINGNIISSCNPITLQTSQPNCSTNFTYINPQCLTNGDYIIEVNFEGETNTLYDLYADWDGNPLFSVPNVSPGFYTLGPFNGNQDVGIIVEDKNNPNNCFDSELILSPTNPTNCITWNNNTPTCDVPTGLSTSISGSTVTFSWNAVSGATNYEICESIDGINDSGCITVTGTSASINGYTLCETFFFRVKAICSSDDSVYSPYTPFYVPDPSGGTCGTPSNVNLNENTTSIVVTWSPSSSSGVDEYLVRYREQGGSWSTAYPVDGTSLYLSALSSCTTYEVQVRAICGCSESNWTSIVTTTTNGCSAPKCNDGVQNGTETGVDCGGSCPSCSPGVCDDFLITNPDPNDCEQQFALVTSVKNIIWTPSTCSSGLVNIQYSVNGGNSWQTQISNTADDGIYQMTFTNAHVSTQFRLRVVCTTGGYCAETCNYIITGDSVAGCNDPNAHNYNPSANYNNGTCQTCFDGILNGDETGTDCGGSNPLCNPCNPANNIQITGPACNNSTHAWGSPIEVTWNPGSNCASGLVMQEYSYDNGQTWTPDGNLTGNPNDGSATFISNNDNDVGEIIYRITCVGNTYNSSISDCSYTFTTCGNSHPAYDEPCGAINLSVGNNNCNLTNYSICDVWNSNVPPPPCGAFKNADMWFKAVVPSSGNLNVEIQNSAIFNPKTALYGGSCSFLSLIQCIDSGIGTGGTTNTGTSSYNEYRGLTAGSTVYIRFWGANFNTWNTETFDICVYKPQSCTGALIAFPADVIVDCYEDLTDLTITGDVLGETILCPSCSPATYTDNNNYDNCTGGTITRQWSFTDECGITTTQNQLITLNPNIAPPSFTIPVDITIDCQDYTNLSITGTSSPAIFECGTGTLSYTDNLSSYDSWNQVGTILRIWEAIDNCGVIATKIQFITKDFCCPNNLAIPDNPVDNGLYNAANEITSDGIVNQNSDVIYKAGNIVRLTNGFKANHYFKATIEECPQ